MYENVEIDLNNSKQISTDEILKMYGIDTEETEAGAKKTFDIKRSTRKPKEKRI